MVSFSVSLTQPPMYVFRCNCNVNSTVKPSLFIPYAPDRSSLSILNPVTPGPVHSMLWELQGSRDTLIHLFIPYISPLRACYKAELNKYF